VPAISIIRGAPKGARALLLAGALAAAGCAAPSSYAGISLKPGAAEPALQALALRAQAGDKQAQLDLGIRYEQGNGVRPSREHAIRLYSKAARASGGVTYVYNPPVAKGQLGALHRIDGGVVRSGLPEAARRLARLRGTAAGSTGSVAHTQPEDAR
jgi:TPR repeat protein